MTADGIPPIKTVSPVAGLFEPVRRWRDGRRTEKELRRLRSPYVQFRTLVDTATQIAAINPLGLADLARALLRPLQSDYLIGAAAMDNYRGSEVEPLRFFCGSAIASQAYSADGRTYRGRTLNPKNYQLSLARDLILPWPWRRDRYIDAIAKIGAAKAFESKDETHRWRGPWKHDRFNHVVELWLPWGIAFVEGGNHSIAAGVLAGEGFLVPNSAYDMGFLLDEIECNGRYFVSYKTGKSIAPMYDPRRGALFEIGRLLRTHGVVPVATHEVHAPDRS